MAKFGMSGSKGAASVKTVLHVAVAAASMRRCKIYDVGWGCNAAVADNTFNYQIQRASTVATGAAVTPNALDPADTLASTLQTVDTVTVDGTLTAGAVPLRIPVNQRASFRWVSVQGGEIVLPATASAGVSIGVDTATTTTFICYAQVEEQ